MVAAMFGNGPVNRESIGGDKLANFLGSVIEETLDAILLLVLQGDAALALEQGVGGPGSTPKEAGGMGTGGHGVEILVELGDGDILGFIDGEEQAGGGTHDAGAGFAGEELQAGFAQLVDVTTGGLPAETRADAGIEGGADTIHGIEGLGTEGGRDGDDAPADGGTTKEQPGEDMGLELVLTGLARENDNEGEAEIMNDGFFDGKGDLDLVGTQEDTAGTSPGDGAAAEGGTDEGG